MRSVPAASPKPRRSVKTKFTPEEDERLTEVVMRVQPRNWADIAQLMGNRSARQCRERWQHYLDPKLKNGPWTEAEDVLLEDKIFDYGLKWTGIAGFFVNRSLMSLRNRWNERVRRAEKLQLENQEKRARGEGKADDTRRFQSSEVAEEAESVQE
jgi:hypothetical protein